jgi:hypothetical protein
VALQLAIEMTSDELKALGGIARLKSKVDELNKSLRDARSEAKQTSATMEDGFGQAAGSLASYAAGFVSFTAIMAAATKGYDNLLKNTREFGAETRKAANELVTLASIQAGGERAKAVELASKLAVSYGIADRGAAFNVVQTLQSARGGNLAAALKGAADVFAASQVGVPIQFGQEAEVFGTSFGMAPGELLKNLFVAGQISPREPETLVKAAPALAFWVDKMAGIAASTVISGSVPTEELGVYTKAAGIALSSQAADKFRESLAKMGAGPGLSQFQKAVVLKERGVDTAEELGAMGLQEIRETKALVTLLSGNNLRMMGEYMAEIPRRAAGDVFAGQRAGIEAELPMARFARESAILEAMHLQEKAFGPSSEKSERQGVTELIRGMALRKMGHETTGPFGMFDLIDEQGRSTIIDEMLFIAMQPPVESVPRGRRLRQAMEEVRFGEGGLGAAESGEIGPPAPPAGTRKGTRINDSMAGAAAALMEVARELKDATRRMIGGAVGVPAGKDR